MKTTHQEIAADVTRWLEDPANEITRLESSDSALANQPLRRSRQENIEYMKRRGSAAREAALAARGSKA
jgi:hypothetical protein